MKKLIGLLIAMASTAQAYELNVQADAYVLYHPATQTMVTENNAQKQIYPASLTKLMTLYLLFEQIKQGKLSLDSKLPVSEKAWRKGGSKMFVEVGKEVRVEDLIRGIIVASGNDACIVVAEYLGGTETGFASMMNAKAAQLGLAQTHYTNATGWPDPELVTSAEDVVHLAADIQRDFPEFYPYFSQTVFTYSGIRQQNRNGLLRQNVGVDGMKTGHTEKAGYHMVASGTEEGERLISVVIGTDGFAAREGESLKLLRYGFTQFKTQNLWKEGDEILEAPVWLGVQPKAVLVAGKGQQAYLPRRTSAPKNVTVRYTSPLKAPLMQGQQVGEMSMEIDGRTFTTPLLVQKHVYKASWFEGWVQKLFYKLGFSS